ncbi:hypothetical protein OPV22_005705 [Ensete ventricosum]|uniref:Uncharacterized protein n=1 Tax=Ensete ventricosum TaxID=4639 RepID=A0AAV8RLL2_ENSVE|nr:hypothetical protein OPV22_005705 [Ensete ventricosum]
MSLYNDYSDNHADVNPKRRLRGVPQAGGRGTAAIRSLGPARSGTTGAPLPCPSPRGGGCLHDRQGHPRPPTSSAPRPTKPPLSLVLASDALPGLAGSVGGVGGHAPGMMQPQMSCPTVPQILAAPVFTSMSSARRRWVRCQGSRVSPFWSANAHPEPCRCS